VNPPNKIRVRLFNQAIPSQIEVVISDHYTAKDLMDYLCSNVLSSESGALSGITDRENLMVIVNGTPIQQCEGWKTPLHAGDEVSVMVMMGGG
jgi:molybdopterin converting factor small subunit